MDLAVSEVVRHFAEHPNKDLMPTFPFLRPKGGEVYIFFPKDDSCKSELISEGSKCRYLRNMAMKVCLLVF